MRATELLQQQLEGVNARFHAILDDLTDEEWTTRVMPETNLIAFELWHVARSPDWTVFPLRVLPEIASQDRWASCGTLATPGFGLQLTRAQADTLAKGLTRADVGAYADAVTAEVVAWVGTVTEEDLDTIPDLPAILDAATGFTAKGLTNPEVRKEILENYEGAPLWGYLAGACIGHCRGHLAQLELFKEQLRLRQASTVAPVDPPAPSAKPAEAKKSKLRRRRWWWPFGHR